MKRPKPDMHLVRLELLSDFLNDISDRRRRLKLDGSTKAQMDAFDKKEFDRRNEYEKALANMHHI
jgi:hypothetical protein